MQYSTDFKKRVLSIYGNESEFSIAESSYGQSINMEKLLDDGADEVGLFLEHGEYGILKNTLEPEEVITAYESSNFQGIYLKAKRVIALQELAHEWRRIADYEDNLKNRSRRGFLLSNLRYGYYQEFFSGDGSMYDYMTAYTTASKHYTIFEEDSCNYYDILDEHKPYKKDAEYEEASVTIEKELLDILPNGIDSSREYTLDEILSLLPRIIVANLVQKNPKGIEKVL